MKNLRLTITLGLIFSFFMSAFAQKEVQSLGYMGKRLALKYSIGMSFSGINTAAIDLNSSFQSNKRFKIPISHTADIEYVVKERGSLFFNYSFTSIKRKIDEGLLSNHTFIGAGDNPASTTKWHTMGLSYRFYSKSRYAFAPFGNYFGYRAGIISGKASQYVYYRETSSSNRIYSIQQESFFSIYAGMEFGRQFVLFKRMLLDVNFRCNLPINILYGFVGNASQNEIKRNALNDVFFSEIFQFKIALGGLIF